MPSDHAAHTPVHLSRGFKFTWGVAALGTQLINGTYGAMLLIFYQDYLGLAARWIAWASLAYAIWNAINDPLFGYITDRTRTRLGRRIPYMRFTAPFLALTFIALWFAPPESGQQTLFWWMLVTMLLFDTAYTIIGLAYNSLMPEMTESDAERNSLQISSSLFGLLGILLGFLIPDFFRPKAGSEATLDQMQIAMVVVAVTCALLIIFTTYRVKERLEFTVVDRPLGLLESLRYTFTSRSFLVLVAATFMSVLTSALLVGAIFYLSDYVLQMRTIFLLASLFIPLLVGIPLTSVIRARLGVVRTQQVLLAVAGAGLVLIPLAPTELIPLCIALAGFGLAGPQTLTNILFAQVVDEDEVRSGVRREGVFFGVNALITKPAQSLALALSPFILEATGFITRGQNLGRIFLDQPGSALLGIKVISGLIPGLALLAAALILFAYPLHGAYLDEIKEKVLDLHARKREAYEAALQQGAAGTQPFPSPAGKPGSPANSAEVD